MSEIIFEFPEAPQIDFLTDLQGQSLYNIWLGLGNVGDHADFLQWLRVTGASAYQEALDNGFVGTSAEWIQSLEGTSAYELAVQGGFSGTLEQWILSLEGTSAYEAAVENGFIGTELQWLESLEGTSAYEIAVQNGYSGTEAEWVESLKGENAYELAVLGGYVGTQAQWIASLKVGIQDSLNSGVTDVAPSQDAVLRALALKAPLASPTFTGTVSGITKAMIGLAYVDNTSDANKPVSVAQQAALDLKANLASPTFTGNVSGITKSMVGLDQVDNTSDLNKPISSATQTALGNKQSTSTKNQPNGYAGLGSDGKIQSAQLPSITISDTFIVNSQSEMLALTAETGDVAIRADLSKSFIMKGSVASDIASWQELLSPASPVSSVFGRVGSVTANLGDYNADQITETTTRKFQTANQKLYNDATSSIQTQLNARALSSRILTINGVAYDLSADRSWTISAGTGTVSSVSGTGTVSGLTLTGTVTSSGSLTLGGTLSLTSAQITAGLGFTPYNATNPNGYLSSISSANVVSALGYTPYNSSNPSGYITGISSGMVTSALGYTPYNSSNPSGYITSSGSISGNAATATNLTNLWINGGTTFASAYDSLASNRSSQNFIYNTTDMPLAGGLYSVIMNKADASYGSMLAVNIEPNTGSLYSKVKYGGTWYGWKAILDAGNYSSYALPLSGGTISGNVYVTKLGNTYTINPHQAGVDLHSTGNIAPHYQSTFSWYTGAIGSGVFKASLDASGNFTAAGDVIAYSDRRVKENISTLSNALSKLRLLRGVSYTRKDNEDKSEKIGVIAQEIQEVIPQVVQKQADGMLGVSYGNLAGLFIEAIKEQQIQIDALKYQVQSLIH